jgi:4-alpha-glucanotransferase
MKDTSYLTHSPTAKHWQDIAIKHHHGIAIPLFSLHSFNSYGIGEFTDLPLLIDWCASIGFDVIQILPINDTGLGISPYSSLSAFALHPIFLGISSLPHINEHPFLMEELKLIPKFSSVPHVDYARVWEYKEHFLRHYYLLFGSQIVESEDYQKYIQNASWLKGYAVFKILKKRYQGSSWETWPESERWPTPALLDTLAFHEREEFNWYCFLQFLCDQQLKNVKVYASQKKIFLMGDIPILIDRESADVWLHQDLFNLQYSAGAPPDYFNEEGQNWGFPLYDWKAMEEDGHQWWVNRLQWASNYYHIYRIDHIVGFFRIWSIPLGVSGKHGHFIPRDEKIWINHGQRILMMMLNTCSMLPIGEDLGVVPPEARTCLSALGICGTRVMRWERKWNEDGQFILPENYPVDSMTTVSTHDTEPLQLWWKLHPLEAQLFADFKGWSHQSILSREHHREILWDSHHTASLFHINPLQEYLALIPGLSWPNPEDERINTPGLFSDHNWRYRLHLSLEELADQNSLKHLMQELIQ